MSIPTKIYIMRHERVEASQTYADILSQEQITFLLSEDNADCDFWLVRHSAGDIALYIIEDEG